MPYNKIKKPNLVKEVYKQLRDQIVRGEISEGEKLLSENKLCLQFDVSRVVIREALQTLKANQLIVTKQGKGSFVANPENFILSKYDTSCESITERVTEEVIMEFYTFRDLIEKKGLELAAKNITEEDKIIIASKLDKMDEAQGNTENYSLADFEFHYALMKAGRNDFLSTSYKSCKNLIMSCLLKLNSFHDSHKWGVDMHRKLYEFILDGKIKEAKNLISKNDDYNLARIDSILYRKEK